MSVVWDEHGGATVLRDGHQQSYVDPDDPLLLVFEYVQHLALVLQALRPDPAPLAVTHVGGAGMTFARWVHRVHPGSPQIVLEPDVALTELVRREIPLPRGHRVRVRPLSGQEGVAGLRDGSADVVVVDAFDGGRVPGELAGAAWARELARVLAPDGVVLANVADDPGLRWVARYCATLGQELEHVGQMVLREVASGRRFGNVVVVGSRRPLDDVALTRAAARSPFPSLWRDARLTRRAGGGARPFGEVGEPSPEPREPGTLRLR